jgi:SAM-dependent methyltransferase
MKKRLIDIQNRICPICFNKKGYYLITVNNIKILRCNQCNMVFADVNETTVEKTCKYSREKILEYYKFSPLSVIAYYDTVIEKIITTLGNTNIKLLEFGCGSGMFLRRARKKGLIIQGVDFSEYSKYASKAFNLDIITADLDDCHFPSDYFDVIYSHATFEHLYSPLKIAEELVRILKPGGMFIITGVPNYNTLSIKLFHNFYNNCPPGHINYFEVKTMKYMYKLLDLEEIKISTYGINFWILFYLLQQSKQKKNLVQSKEISDEELIYQIKHETTNLDTFSTTLFQKAMANIYYNARLPKMGIAVSTWGLKSKDKENNVKY